MREKRREREANNRKRERHTHGGREKSTVQKNRQRTETAIRGQSDRALPCSQRKINALTLRERIKERGGKKVAD